MISLRDIVIFLAGVMFLHTVSHIMVGLTIQLPFDFKLIVLTNYMNTWIIVLSAIITILLLWWAVKLSRRPMASLAQSEKSNSKNQDISPTVTHQVVELAKKNDNWKEAVLTGKHNQVVFMNVSPHTNPKNEIGMETHPFDQIIFIAEGSGKAELNGKISSVKAGDMIFIPEGTDHNVINTNRKKGLKIISVYSDTDIPANSVIKTKENEPGS